jgi:GNAT superfamily N-acetyltransferase
MAVIIRRIRADEGLRWREVRLRALRSDPLAFGSTFEGAAARPEGDWVAMALGNASSDDRATFLAVDDERIVGLAVVNRDDERADVFAVYQVWVAPEARGRGAGSRLIAALEAWVLERGGAALELMVSDAAPAARRLYERAGFLPDARREATSHPGVTEEHGMSKRLRR